MQVMRVRAAEIDGTPYLIGHPTQKLGTRAAIMFITLISLLCHPTGLRIMSAYHSASRTALAAVRLSLPSLPRSTAAVTTGFQACVASSSRGFSASARRDEPPHPDLLTADEVPPDLVAHAKRFAQMFAYSDIPKDALEISFARSSGPGGQVSRFADVAFPHISIATRLFRPISSLRYSIRLTVMSTVANTVADSMQHVNKTESKAQIRCDIETGVGKWLPPYLAKRLRESVSLH